MLKELGHYRKLCFRNASNQNRTKFRSVFEPIGCLKGNLVSPKIFPKVIQFFFVNHYYRFTANVWINRETNGCF